MRAGKKEGIWGETYSRLKCINATMQKCALEKKKGFGTKPRSFPKNPKVQKCTPEKKIGAKPIPGSKNA
jgi:hypothetical protein